LPHLDVYGQDHSPWVQAVLLGLYERGVSQTLTTVPPCSVFRKSGILMPAASVDGGSWLLDSAEILQQVGYEPVARKDALAIYRAWQGVGHRPDRAVRFWHAFSLIRDPHPSLLLRLRNHFLRSFATLYFYLLIRFMVLSGAQPDPENFGDQFLYWERKLEESEGAYLGGDVPDTLDMMLFGIIQARTSGLLARLDVHADGLPDHDSADPLLHHPNPTDGEGGQRIALLGQRGIARRA
jgi:hypothetical protein